MAPWSVFFFVCLFVFSQQWGGKNGFILIEQEKQVTLHENQANVKHITDNQYKKQAMTM